MRVLELCITRVFTTLRQQNSKNAVPSWWPIAHYRSTCTLGMRVANIAGIMECPLEVAMIVDQYMTLINPFRMFCPPVFTSSRERGAFDRAVEECKKILTSQTPIADISTRDLQHFLNRSDKSIRWKEILGAVVAAAIVPYCLNNASDIDTRWNDFDNMLLSSYKYRSGSEHHAFVQSWSTDTWHLCGCHSSAHCKVTKRLQVRFPYGPRSTHPLAVFGTILALDKLPLSDIHSIYINTYMAVLTCSPFIIQDGIVVRSYELLLRCFDCVRV